MKYLLALALLLSCTTTQKYERVEFQWHYLAFDSMPTDLKYESIELEEIRQYWFECKNMIQLENRFYIKDQFDCEDFTRQLKAYIMLKHSYNLTPAICDARIKGHSLLGFVNNKREFILLDAQTGKVVKNVTVLKRIY